MQLQMVLAPSNYEVARQHRHVFDATFVCNAGATAACLKIITLDEVWLYVRRSCAELLQLTCFALVVRFLAQLRVAISSVVLFYSQRFH
jgi:hypothetical protein